MITFFKIILLPLRDFFLKITFSPFINSEFPLTPKKQKALTYLLHKNKYRLGLFTTAKNHNRVIVYMSNNHKTGLADTLRTMRTAYLCAALNGRKLFIYHHTNSFKLCDYLIPNQIDWRIEKCDIDFSLKNISVCYNYNTIPHISHDKEIHMYISNGIIAEMTNAPTSPMFSDYAVHNQLFKPSSTLELKIQKVMNENQLIENEYVAFHLRFLNFFEPVEIDGKVFSSQEEQLEMINDVHRVIEKIQQTSPTKKVLLFSDSNFFLTTNHPAYIKYIPGTVGHIAKHSDTAIIEKTFIDLYVMSKAKAIYSIRGKNIYGGGFAREAAIIGNKPFIEIPLKEGDTQGFIGTYGDNT